eukprot:5547313-Prymnesium_polylepis.1
MVRCAIGRLLGEARPARKLAVHTESRLQVVQISKGGGSRGASRPLFSLQPGRALSAARGARSNSGIRQAVTRSLVQLVAGIEKT